VKVLIVEDMNINRILLKNILKSFEEIKYIDEAVNGIEAVEKIIKAYKENNKYDIIFLDIIMPMQSGYHVLEQIEKYEIHNDIDKENRSKIIIISSLNNDKNLKSRIDDIIIKPINYDMIKNIFNK
jgi:two-component system chemotaxis response regulator CheY